MATDIVAVDAGPIKWAIFCEECDSYIGEPTEDEDVVERACAAHEASH
jgi:hypothetical protein